MGATRQDYLDFHEWMCSRARELSARKNADYAGKGGEEPFANFRRVGAMGITTPQKGFLVRITDKLSRLASFSDAGEFQVTDESITDTVLDVINYVILMEAERRDALGQSLTMPPEGDTCKPIRLVPSGPTVRTPGA